MPISVNDDRNIITRTNLPVISMPMSGPDTGSKNGIRDTVLTAFLSPANQGKSIWGTGPVLQIPIRSAHKCG